MLKKLYRHLFCQKHMERRIPVLILSVVLMGLCIAIFDQVDFGTDPCTVFNLGVSRHLLGWELGPWQLLFSGVLMAAILLLKEGRRIGLGTLANMVLVGYSVDFFRWVINSIHPLTGETLMVRLMVFAPAMVLFLVVVAFYMVVDLGVGPFDAIPQIIAARAKIPFAPVRMAYDILALLIGWLLGSTVGVVTLVTGFCLGPIISAIAAKFRPWFE